MEFIKVKTRAFLPPKDDIFKLFDKFLPSLKQGDILIVTSKILAIHQGRCVKISGKVDRQKLVMKEAEKYLPGNKKSDKPIFTIKNGTIVSSAGIDESNGNGYYILRPEKINQAAKEIRSYLKKKFKLNKLGVIITDSVSAPFHLGAMGSTVGFYGLEPLKDYRGTKDIFGRELKYERANLIDPLAALGVLMIGEGNERTPMLVIRGADFIKFSDKDNSKNFYVLGKEDKFFPILKIFKEKK
ncbi:MAG: coenzyme F420-0:L-glutamate ligase [Patescibacteria group bacterium]|nr:coenzyme F420-0:L-glutamate ligase [Patescibacteria group bacterium]